MNIAHCIHGLGLGGAQQILKTIVKRRDRQPFRYFVYCCLDGSIRDELEEAGATVRIIERRFPKLDPSWVIKLATSMRHDSIDLVHAHLFGDSLHGYLAARLGRRLPVVATLHAKPDILPALQKLGYRWLLGRLERVVTCSESTQRSYVDATWPGAAGFRVIANGIEDGDGNGGDVSPENRQRLRRELGLDPEATVLGSVGRLSEEKGCGDLIRAFARLVRYGETGIQLVLIGDGPLRDKLRSLAGAEGVDGQVVFAGSRPAARQLLPAIDTVVFSSFSEGLSVALLEAMAASRSIVGTETTGILEAVRPEREALTVPVNSVAKLSEAMRRLVSDPELRAKLGRAARRRFLERFTADCMVREYEALYHEIRTRWEAR